MDTVAQRRSLCRLPSIDERGCRARWCRTSSSFAWSSSASARRTACRTCALARAVRERVHSPTPITGNRDGCSMDSRAPLRRQRRCPKPVCVRAREAMGAQHHPPSVTRAPRTHRHRPRSLHSLGGAGLAADRARCGPPHGSRCVPPFQCAPPVVRGDKEPLGRSAGPQPPARSTTSSSARRRRTSIAPS
jgi:hypothetical protein